MKHFIIAIYILVLFTLSACANKTSIVEGTNEHGQPVTSETTGVTEVPGTEKPVQAEAEETHPADNAGTAKDEDSTKDEIIAENDQESGNTDNDNNSANLPGDAKVESAKRIDKSYTDPYNVKYRASCDCLDYAEPDDSDFFYAFDELCKKDICKGESDVNDKTLCANCLSDCEGCKKFVCKTCEDFFHKYLENRSCLDDLPACAKDDESCIKIMAGLNEKLAKCLSGKKFELLTSLTDEHLEGMGGCSEQCENAKGDYSNCVYDCLYKALVNDAKNYYDINEKDIKNHLFR